MFHRLYKSLCGTLLQQSISYEETDLTVRNAGAFWRLRRAQRWDDTRIQEVTALVVLTAKGRNELHAICISSYLQNNDPDQHLSHKKHHGAQGKQVQ